MMGCESTWRSTSISSSSFIPLLLFARASQRHAALYTSVPAWSHSQEPCAPDGCTVFDMYLRTGHASRTRRVWREPTPRGVAPPETRTARQEIADQGVA